jgi:hypothetical protein
MYANICVRAAGSKIYLQKHTSTGDELFVSHYCLLNAYNLYVCTINRTKPSSQDPRWGEEIRLSLRNAAAPLLSQSDESAAVLSATVYHKTGFGSDMVIGRVRYC